MDNIKLRYVYQNFIFKTDFSFYMFSIEDVEDGALIRIKNSGMRSNGYILISRDMYTGKQDVDVIEYKYDGNMMEHGGKGVFTVKLEKNARYLSFDCLAGKESYEMKIIGNRYQNKELLEECK